MLIHRDTHPDTDTQGNPYLEEKEKMDREDRQGTWGNPRGTRELEESRASQGSSTSQGS